MAIKDKETTMTHDTTTNPHAPDTHNPQMPAHLEFETGFVRVQRLPVLQTKEQLLMAAERSRTLRAEADGIEAAANEARKDARAKTTRKRVEASEQDDITKTWHAKQDVKVGKAIDYKAGRVYFVRLDTGKVLEDRAIYPEETQQRAKSVDVEPDYTTVKVRLLRSMPGTIETMSENTELPKTQVKALIPRMMDDNLVCVGDDDHWTETAAGELWRLDTELDMLLDTMIDNDGKTTEARATSAIGFSARDTIKRARELGYVEGNGKSPRSKITITDAGRKSREIPF